MNNKTPFSLKELKVLYSNKELLKSVLTGGIFFFFPAAFLGGLTINIAPLYYYRFIYIMIILYLLLLVVNYFSSHIMVITLKNYHNYAKEFNYNHLLLIIIIISSIIISFLFVGGMTYAYFQGML